MKRQSNLFDILVMIAITGSALFFKVGQIHGQVCTDSLCTGLQGYWNLDQMADGTTPVPRPNSATSNPHPSLEDGPVLYPPARYSYTKGVVLPDKQVNNAAANFPFNGTCLDGACPTDSPARNVPYLTTQTAGYPARGTNKEFAVTGWFRWFNQYFSSSATFPRPLAEKLGDSPLDTSVANYEYAITFNHTLSNTSLTGVSLRMFAYGPQSKLYSHWSIGGTINNTDADVTGKWNFFAVGYDGTNFKIYLNGKQVVSQVLYDTDGVTPIVPINVDNALLLVGGHMSPSTSRPVFSDAFIDELGIWNRWLSSTELNKLYDCRPETTAWGCPFPFNGTTPPPPTPQPSPSATPTPSPAATPSPSSLPVTWAWYKADGQYCPVDASSTGYNAYYHPSNDCSSQCGTSNTPPCEFPVAYTYVEPTQPCSTDGSGFCRRLYNPVANSNYNSYYTYNPYPTQCNVSSGQLGSAFSSIDMCIWSALSQTGCPTLISSLLSYTPRETYFAVRNNSPQSTSTYESMILSWNKPGLYLTGIKSGATYIAENPNGWRTPFTLDMKTINPSLVPVVNPNAAKSLTFYFNNGCPTEGFYDLTLNTKYASGQACTTQIVKDQGPLPGGQPGVDVNCDGRVDGADVQVLTPKWGLTEAPVYDISQDNKVNSADFGLIYKNAGN